MGIHLMHYTVYMTLRTYANVCVEEVFGVPNPHSCIGKAGILHPFE